ncbi:DUF5916 domain-containing protein [Sphingobacterium faecale]|uniref:Carbohydrate binding family 9 domain-containing protein n=1 Tax=Sphingobacterium faecale TaxID=2803775 RepID=A0ABS1QXI6_9SPHI|nr:DUF5916 domain-containing protein [Sphingobacterium faecale]MBL1407134.1 carbohydrate binding family 9 domain-containing protein [Sphingobacterium faecale]
MKYYCSLLCCLLCSFLSRAQHNERKEVVSFEDAYKRVYTITKLGEGERPRIDGKLEESLWQEKGEWSEKFSQVIPFERAYTGSWTKVKLFYDDVNIYIGVYCKDVHPETMNAFIGNRDDNSNGDLISIAFDTYHDYRVASEFNLNLGGNKTDLTVTDKLSVNLSWNAVWEGQTHINKTDSCWTAELRIPFSQLRYNQENEDGKWGLHVRRIIRRNNEVQNWSLIPIKNNGHVFSFGEMHGMTDLPKPKGIEFLPYAMAKFSKEPKISGSPFQNGSSWGRNVGLDAKIALSDFTMDLTVNPDYGQVELDPSVMNLSAYEIFYDEKRPFFLEGKHILEFDNNEGGMMFYSRRVGAMPSYQPKGIDNVDHYASTANPIPILGALKLTGTNKNGVTVGLLESITAQTSSQVMRNGVQDREITEPLTNYTVARVQKNWEGNTLLGGMLTSVNRNLRADHLKDALIENAFAAGIDFTQYFANRLYYIDAKGMFSTLHGSSSAILNTKQNAAHYYQRESGQSYLDLRPEQTTLQGSSGYVKAGKKGNAQWNFSQTFSWASPGFDLNDVGYMKQADYKSNESEVVFRKTDPWGPFRFAGINLTQKNVWNYGGKAVNNDFAVRWRSLSIKRRVEMDIKETFNWNTIDSRRLRGGPDMRYNTNLETNAMVSTDRAKPIMFKMEYNGRYYWDESTAYNTVHPSMVVRLGNHLRMAGQFNYAWNKDNLQYVSTVKTDGANAYILGRMDQKTYGVTLNLQLNVTPDISIQYYGSPFTSTAVYDRFKLGKDMDARKYGDRFTRFASDGIQLVDGNYIAKEGKQDYAFKNPDFSFNEFRSNLVARWEYLPGSTIYIVWEHNQSRNDMIYQPGWGNNLDRMFGLPATNTFMMKVNYWFSL